VAAVALTLASCSGKFFHDPSGEPIKAMMTTAVPLAYAASVALASVNGSPPSNVLSTNRCASYPCVALVAILADGQAPPLLSETYGSGQIVVSGLWNSPQAAILTVAFVDLLVGDSLVQVRSVSTFPMVVTPTGLRIVYASIDVNVASGPRAPTDLSPDQIDALFMRFAITPSSDPMANVGLNAWVVDVDDGGTPLDFTDDTYTVNGGGEYIEASDESGDILQMGVVGAAMEPNCALNPEAGLAAFNETGASTSDLPVLATALIGFESGCSGRAKVLVATGNYLLSIGKTIPL